ncbi:MAG: MerR family transcriptional regulator [Planctomycetota bacterium]
MTTLRVGEIAERAGVSVRTLHHYHQIGLLVPSAASDGGHRRYTSVDVVRLQQIRSLVDLGLPLEEVGAMLGTRRGSPVEVLRLHRSRLRQRIAHQEELCGRLDDVLEPLETGVAPTVEVLLRSLRATERVRRHFGPEQREALRQREEALGADAMPEAEREWAEIFGDLEDAVVRGVAPTSPEVVALARRARGLIASFTGGDAGLESSLRSLYAETGHASVLDAHGFGIDPAAWQLLQDALAKLPAED